jgi:hypothetical protein
LPKGGKVVNGKHNTKFKGTRQWVACEGYVTPRSKGWARHTKDNKATRCIYTCCISN